jgi:hypothetical protein
MGQQAGGEPVHWRPSPRKQRERVGDFVRHSSSMTGQRLLRRSGRRCPPPSRPTASSHFAIMCGATEACSLLGRSDRRTPPDPVSVPRRSTANAGATRFQVRYESLRPQGTTGTLWLASPIRPNANASLDRHERVSRFEVHGPVLASTIGVVNPFRLAPQDTSRGTHLHLCARIAPLPAPSAWGSGASWKRRSHDLESSRSGVD